MWRNKKNSFVLKKNSDRHLYFKSREEQKLNVTNYPIISVILHIHFLVLRHVGNSFHQSMFLNVANTDH